jgi:hypothetical protein
LALTTENAGALIRGSRFNEEVMMKVKLLVAIRVDGKPSEPGTTVEVSDSLAQELIGTKRAEPVAAEKPAQKKKPAPKKAPAKAEE